MEHPLKADVGCRNTLFNAVPQSGAEIAPQLLAAGVRHFRIELLDQGGPLAPREDKNGSPLAPREDNRLAQRDAGDLRETLDLYRRLLAGDVTGKEVWTRLRATNRVGVTRGTLEERKTPLAIV
jgi:putative protease